MAAFVSESREVLLRRLGLRVGINGPRAERTMMLDDLRVLLAHTSVQATRDDYTTAIVEDNVLGKPTRKSRELALRHLGVLYGLDLTNPLFRALRRLWSRNRSEEHTSELQSLMRISYAVFCLKKKNTHTTHK